MKATKTRKFQSVSIHLSECLFGKHVSVWTPIIISLLSPLSISNNRPETSLQSREKLWTESQRNTTSRCTLTQRQDKVKLLFTFQAPLAALLLMNMPAEQAFWCFAAICDRYIPGYYRWYRIKCFPIILSIQHALNLIWSLQLHL